MESFGINKIRDRPDAVFVPMNEVRFVSFPPTGTMRFLAAENLNGNTCIAIVADSAAILANISPLGDANSHERVQEMLNLYYENFHEFVCAVSYVVGAWYGSDYALPDVVEAAENIVASRKIPLQCLRYDVVEDGVTTLRGETSFAIAARPGKDAAIFLNDHSVND
ncbi:hypothetical protein K461DRAFT_301942 [Myriangium duriaei CBS 260.36]|uniref:Uncharacterized protein n=1 Tax=Myriangium duriaei CBS 260.36 TaxID=1168546 RepID=A0A9P4MC71_9PEZI|nr:hypothetical protein K461DRAFT_301942 [Myriangium duriaei CBS 260.36]